MSEIETTKLWLKSIFDINREIDFEKENAKRSLERIEKLEKDKEEIYGIISVISNPTYKAILHKRYIQGMKWEDIALDLNYAEQHISRLYNKAVKEVHKIKTGQE